jgi:lipopolysaccharide biosynthesis protein
MDESSFEYVENAVRNFIDPTAVKNRRISQAEHELKEIASSKSWKLITFYRHIKTMINLHHISLVRKLVNLINITLGYFLDNSQKGKHQTRNLKSSSSFINKQEQLFNRRVKRQGRVAVVLHLYYVDLWEEIYSYLCHIQEPFDIFISIPGHQNQVISEILAVYPNAFIYFCPNRGRDIAPFIEIYSAIADSGYSIICKIHSKKSQHLSNGDNWRLELFNELLGSPQQISKILNLFQNFPDLGMLVPQGYLYSALDISTINNYSNLEYLANVVNISWGGFDFEYPAGSMFWCRTESISLIRELGFSTMDFPKEHGQLDNTLAHAMERFFGVMIKKRGQFIVDSSVLYAGSKKYDQELR